MNDLAQATNYSFTNGYTLPKKNKRVTEHEKRLGQALDYFADEIHSILTESIGEMDHEDSLKLLAAFESGDFCELGTIIGRSAESYFINTHEYQLEKAL